MANPNGIVRKSGASNSAPSQMTRLSDVVILLIVWCGLVGVTVAASFKLESFDTFIITGVALVAGSFLSKLIITKTTH